MSRALAVLAVVAAGLAAAAASCSVRRQSDAYACTRDRDCDGERTCEDGFCVEPESSSLCPSQCDSCDIAALTCRIDCTTGQPCGAVRCPPGYDCTIRCNNTGACGTVDCALAGSCDIRCNGPASCGNLTCGLGECTISCAGDIACPGIDCGASCSCDVDCSAPPFACPTQTCPLGCTGSDGVCSIDPTGCDRCF